MKIKRGTYLCIAGTVLLLAALSLLIYNRAEDSRAEYRTADILAKLKEQMPEVQADEQTGISDIFITENPSESFEGSGSELPKPDIFAEYEKENGISAEEPAETYYYVYEYSYMGILYLPSLGLELPVMSEWSYPNLKIAPCRYYGSAEGGDLVIAAHNYSCHFGHIAELVSGDEIIYVDGNGTQYTYTVTGSEIIGGQNSAAMTANSDEWDLTLFTCTYGGTSRVTIRAELMQ